MSHALSKLSYTRQSVILVHFYQIKTHAVQFILNNNLPLFWRQDGYFRQQPMQTSRLTRLTKVAFWVTNGANIREKNTGLACHRVAYSVNHARTCHQAYNMCFFFFLKNPSRGTSPERKLNNKLAQMCRKANVKAANVRSINVDRL